MVIGIDFDGTCVTHEYPIIGEDIGAVPILKKLCENNHKLILFTMRGGIELKYALSWFEYNNIPLYGINENPNQKSWTDSPKAWCDLYIDDSFLFSPVKYDKNLSKNPFIDWDKVEERLKLMKII